MESIIDSHCHVDMVFEKGISWDLMIQKMEENQVESLIQIGASPIEMHYARDFAHKKDKPFPAWYTIGFHPNEAEKNNPENGLKFCRENQNDDLFVAVGEIGLDYFYGSDHAIKQKENFKNYLEIAKEVDRPVCIHTRNAHKDTLQILRESKVSKILIHCFTGNRSEMEDFLSLGAWISFSGIVTFKNAEELQEAAIYCPSDKILIETDAPFLTPVPYRGKINHPGMLRHTLDFISKIRNEDAEKLACITRLNTKEFYRLP